MHEKLKVSFNSPQCGWMSIGFTDGANEFHTTTAHAPHKNALPELINILIDLLDRNSKRNDFLLKWNRDPEEFDFEFSRAGNKLNFLIYQYPTEQRDAGNREKVYHVTGDVRGFCRAFHETFTQMKADREVDEFEQNWFQPFPYEEFDRLSAALK